MRKFEDKKIHLQIPKRSWQLNYSYHVLFDQVFPETAFNMVKVLEKSGCTVHYNTDQTCCGQPAFNAGFRDDAKEVCIKFIRDFKGADYIVAPSASCVGFVRNYYPGLFDNSSYHNEVKDLQKRTFWIFWIPGKNPAQRRAGRFFKRQSHLSWFLRGLTWMPKLRRSHVNFYLR